jgi:2-polyprenyl-3-methyl-5-hydroxy-6-metoxy-1,4-benzoquinol methylase
MKQKDKWNAFYSSKKREPFLHLTEEQVDSILKKFPNAASALDIGCGEGQLLIQLEERGISTTGIDISDIGINEAKKRVSGSLIVGDFEQFSFPDTASFDLIFVKFVIAFIQNPEAFFKKIDSLLKTDGGFILLTPVIREPDSSSQKEEVFIEQSILDEYLPRYFSKIEETILYSEGHKRLALYTCTKK